MNLKNILVILTLNLINLTLAQNQENLNLTEGLKSGNITEKVNVSNNNNNSTRIINSSSNISCDNHKQDPSKKKGWAYCDERQTPRDKIDFSWCNPYNDDPGMNLNLMLKEINEIRAKAKVQELVLNRALIRAAVWQATNQNKVNKGGHNGVEGERSQGAAITPGNASFGERILACKFPGFPRSENAADNGGSESETLGSLMTSPHHRENIEDPDIRYFGAARRGKFWAQVFGIEN